MKSFSNINKNNLYLGDFITLGTYPTDFTTYENYVNSAVSNLKAGFPTPFWEDTEIIKNEYYLENFKKVMINHYQEFAGRYLAIIIIDDYYSCVCTIDENFSNSTGWQLLRLTGGEYVYPFDCNQCYPIQRIETKTTWKY